MASSSIGGIFAELTLRDSKFTKGLKGAGASLSKFANSAARYGAMASAALGAGLAVGVKRTIDMGGALTDLSAQTGIAISDLMKIQQAYKDNGKSADSAGKDINKMQKSIYAAANAKEGEEDPFAKLGLSAEKLMAMNPSEQFFAIAQAIKSIQNPAAKTAAAMEIFGKGGGGLLAVFDGADMESVNKSLGQMPEIMQQFAAELDHAGDILGRLPNKSDQFFTGFTTGIISELIPSLESVDQFDFTSIGANFASALGKGINAVTSHIAILFNSVADFAAGDFDFMGSIEKYSAAQVSNESEDAAAADQREKEYADKLAYDAARMEEYRSAPDWVDPNAAAPAAKAKAARIPTPDGEFDSYRSRGLSLSANPSADQEKKQLDIQIKIHRLLERFTETDRGLNWT